MENEYANKKTILSIDYIKDNKKLNCIEQSMFRQGEYGQTFEGLNN